MTVGTDEPACRMPTIVVTNACNDVMDGRGLGPGLSRPMLAPSANPEAAFRGRPLAIECGKPVANRSGQVLLVSLLRL